MCWQAVSASTCPALEVKGKCQVSARHFSHDQPFQPSLQAAGSFGRLTPRMAPCSLTQRPTASAAIRPGEKEGPQRQELGKISLES